MSKAVIGILCLAVVFCLLYRSGLLVLQAKSAVMFVGAKNGTRASFRSCNGWIRRMVRFKEGRVYRFTLTADLSKGEMEAVLLDGKERIFCLTGETPAAEVEVKKGRGYCLLLRFRSASGSYVLDWE